MIEEKIFREFAMSFNNVFEKSHLYAPSFRINDKIFACLGIDDLLACVKLSFENH